MKIKVLIGLVIVFLIVACAENSSPSPVAEKFLRAMRDRDYDEAATYGTKETVKLLQQLERIESFQVGEQRSEMGEVKLVSEEIQGKNATVYFKEDGVPEEQKISLRKVEITDASGKVWHEWKVSLKKEELPIPAFPAVE
jgi:lipopolysaccharide export LptBFGC system permease protein LptF